MRPMIGLGIRIDLGCPALTQDRDHRPRRDFVEGGSEEVATSSERGAASAGST